MAAAPDNPKGFWEHEELVGLNDRLLSRLGTTWSDPVPPIGPRPAPAECAEFEAALAATIRRDFATSAIWGFKDPRASLLIPVYRRVLRTLGIRTKLVFVVRSPEEVARSLRARDGMERARAGWLWLKYNAQVLRTCDPADTVLIDYAHYLADPAGTLSDALHRLNLSAAVAVEARREALAEFVTPSLRHHSLPPAPAGGGPALPDRLVNALWQSLQACAHGEPLDNPDLRSVVAAYLRQARQLRSLWHAHNLERTQLIELGEQNRHLHRENQAYASELSAIEGRFREALETNRSLEREFEQIETYVQGLQAQSRELTDALQAAEDLALARLEALQRADSQNRHLSEALAHAERLAILRLELWERAEATLNQLYHDSLKAGLAESAKAEPLTQKMREYEHFVSQKTKTPPPEST